MTLFAALTLVVAIGPLFWLVRARPVGLREWFAASALAATMSASAVLVGPWALVSVYVRPVFALASIATLLWTRTRAVRDATKPDRSVGSSRRLWFQLGLASVFALVVFDAFWGRFPPRGTVDLQFPLQNGVYVVLQGGRSLVLNPFHQWFRSDNYALDVVKVNRLGNRARGIAPEDLSDYVTFNVPVYSPCTGSVEEVRNHVPDNLPGQTDPENRTGNYILLRCGSVRVLLAHLARESVTVSPTDTVRTGQVIGRVGNSGYTSEPHLHIGAVTVRSTKSWPEAEAMPIAFGRRFLVMNDIVR